MEHYTEVGTADSVAVFIFSQTKQKNKKTD